MKYRPVFTLIIALIIFLAVAIGLDNLVNTQTGLLWIFSAAQHVLPGELEAKSVDGTLFGTLKLQGVHYRNQTIDVTIKDVELTWQPNNLLDRKLLINALQVDGMVWRSLTTTKPQKMRWPRWHLPLLIWIQHLTLKNIQFLPANIHLQASGSVTNNWNVSWQLWSEKGNLFRATGNLQGAYAAPQLNAVFTAHNLTFKQTHIATVKGSCAIDLALVKDSQLNLTLLNLRYEQYSFPKINIAAHGNFKQQTLQLHVTPTTAFAMPEYGIRLQAIQLDARLDHKIITWQGSARSGQGELRVAGKTLMDTADLPTTLYLRANNFTVSNTLDYQVVASSDLMFKYAKEKLDVTGKIILPKALLKFGTGNTQAVELSQDIVFAGDQPTANTLDNLAIHTQIELVLGDNVQLTAQGLQSKLTGNLTITQLPNAPVTAVGQINLLNGQYTYSNQTLIVRPGSRFIYAGNDIADPTLDIKAVKTVTALVQKTNIFTASSPMVLPAQPTQVVVGFNVQGTVKDPQISLFAEPAGLSQADILSYILFDQPSDQVTGINSQLLFTAASSLNIGGGAGEFKHLMQSLQKTVKLDQFSIQSSPYFDPTTNTLQQNTSLVLGKALSPKLYISYSVGLLQPINILQIRYLLNKYWSLQSTTSSLDNGVDLLYTIEGG